MSLPVLIGFAGGLVAAVATGVLAGRCFHQPRMYLILWTAATLGLAVALAAQSKGFASGFGLATFRAAQLPTQLFAPLWLAWGLVELVAGSEAARFGMRLVSSALTVVAAVILAVRRPWEQSKPLPTVDAPNLDVLHPEKLVTLQCVIGGGGPCSVRVTGHHGEALDRLTFNMAGETRSAFQRVAGPLAIDSITIERGGKTHRQELNLTIPGGQKREILVNADDTVELRPGS